MLGPLYLMNAVFQTAEDCTRKYCYTPEIKWVRMVYLQAGLTMMLRCELEPLPPPFAGAMQ